MANSKISALASASTPLAGTETLPIVQSGVTKQVSVANLTVGRTVGTGAINATGAITLNNSIPLNWKNASGTTRSIMQLYSDNNVYVDADDGSQIYRTAGYERWRVADASLTFTSTNLVQGTAAKGVNFTANTPAAGMTSQLLNWYEEGTYTPTITASSGTLTTVTASGNYTRIGRQITVNISITLTNIGTASGALIATLPYTCGLFPAIGTGREDQNTGAMLQPRIGSATPGSTYIVTYNNTTVIATGNVAQVTITYFV